MILRFRVWMMFVVYFLFDIEMFQTNSTGLGPHSSFMRGMIL